MSASNAPIPGVGGEPKVVLAAPDGARAEIYLHGAHVTSWVPAGKSEDRLFVSSRSEFGGTSAIRGGIPVIFPQFADQGPLPKHGFARNRRWTLVSADASSATLRLTDSDETREMWPHAFAAELTVTIGGAGMEVALELENTGDGVFAFTAALHTYLRVDEVSRASIFGLRGTRYRDKTENGAEFVENGAALRIAGEVDRMYLDAPHTVEMREPHRVLEVRSAGFPDVVVWNPWVEGGAGLKDMEPGGYERMLCIEAAAAGEAVHVAPGERWRGLQSLTAQ